MNVETHIDLSFCKSSLWVSNYNEQSPPAAQHWIGSMKKNVLLFQATDILDCLLLEHKLAYPDWNRRLLP